MWALRFLLTASIFAGMFIAMALVSAVATKTLHEQLSAKAAISRVGP
jgi:hypothetical protein